MTGNSFLQDSLETIGALVGNFDFGTPRSSLVFDAAPPSVPFSQLAGFSEPIEYPSTRLCCTIGFDTSRFYVPDASATRPLEVHNIGLDTHIYGGPGGSLTSVEDNISIDPVGHLYTTRGGIVDVAHARDHADIARFMAVQARSKLQAGGTVSLSDEGGGRKVTFLPQSAAPDAELCARLGARISYDISVWHEILSWASTGLLESQPYSAFSPEDNFSNLLGAYLGYVSVLTPDTTFDAAMSEHMLMTLFELGAVPKAGSVEAILHVKDFWYEYSSFLGSLVLLRRHFNANDTVTPWLITDVAVPGKGAQLGALHDSIGSGHVATSITAPTLGAHAESLASYYTFEIDVSAGDIPSAFFDGRTKVTSAELPGLVAKVKAEVLTTQPNGDQRG